MSDAYCSEMALSAGSLRLMMETESSLAVFADPSHLGRL